MKIKIKFLGQGPFAEPIREVLEKRFVFVEDNPDLQIVANYGRILKKEEIASPRYGTLNIHPSCLPKYRGAMPLQAAILNGERTTCVCIIKMVEQVDAGPVLVCQEVEILPDEILTTLTAKTAKLAAKILPYTILGYISGSISPQKQVESQATFTKRLTREDGKIDLSKPPVELERQIRAYHPWPGSFMILPDSSRLIIHKAHLEDDRLVPDLVQREGKKIVSFAEFKRGFRGDLGGVF